ncbi:MAG: FliH/SctL family protein [Gemmatimonadaceae bacterium]|nr:FliH/SctL family protein [Gemmatimonadaceae bacterium]
MSSFEPLFTAPGRTRITPRVVRPVSASSVWMPMSVGGDAPRAPSIFETELDDAQHGADGGEDAAAQAAAELAAAQARQDELDAAYLRGMQEGRDQGEQAERARLRGAMMAAESALDDVRAGESRWLANLEENIAAIAIAVAQQVVTREVTLSTEIVIEMVTRAVQEFGLDQALSIRVNPGDLEALLSAERDGDDPTVITRGREVRWLSDARIEKGGCVVEGRERIVDGRVDTGLERLYRRLTYTSA